MKHLLLLLVICILISPVIAATNIPEDSKQVMDFRGSPNFTDVEYAKLYKCKTYEDLREQLLKAIKSISPRKGEEWEDASQSYTVALCQFALIRVNYILGDTKVADKLLLNLHPVNN